MNDQRNLYLAIGISIAIIIFFQILLPTQPIEPPPLNEEESLEPATSIDGKSKQFVDEIKSKEDALNTTKFGVPINLSVFLNSFFTSSNLLQSQETVSIFISFFNFSNFLIFLEARTTCILFDTHRRASDELRPGPAPTINTFSLMFVLNTPLSFLLVNP